MLYKGTKYSRADSVVTRQANGEDRYTNGKPIPSNFCVFIKAKDVLADRGEEYFYSEVLKTKKIIPIKNHSLTNLMIAEPTIIKRRGDHPVQIINKKGQKDWTYSQYIKKCVTYLAYDGMVFRHTVTHEATEEEYKAFKLAK